MALGGAMGAVRGAVRVRCRAGKASGRGRSQPPFARGRSGCIPRNAPGVGRKGGVGGNFIALSGRGKRSGPICEASQEAGRFQGQFGTWQLEDSDKTEVFLYRLGLTGCAGCFAAIAIGLLATHGWDTALNTAYFVGSSSFGLSLVLIHIYVKPLKRLLQALWLTGMGGSLYLMLSGDGSSSLPRYLVEHPQGLWLAGPLFASIAGVAFKEGFCYGKKESFALFAITPFLFLGHIFQVADASFESGLLVAWAVSFLLFAGGKWSQAVHEDIGDKSVFEFLELPEDEQQAVLARMENERQ